MRKRSLVLVVAAMAVLVVVAVLSRAPQPVTAVLPSPNGYADLLAAGEGVKVPVAIKDLSQLEESVLEGVVATNAAGLEMARQGLEKECAVPMEYTMDYLQAHSQEMGNLKRVAGGFVAEGELAQRQGRLEDAVRSYVDTIRLGVAVGQNGMLIDALVGISIEAMGMGRLQSRVADLDPETCSTLGRELERLRENAVKDDVAIANDRACLRMVPVYQRFILRLVNLMPNSSMKKVEASYRAKSAAHDQQRQALIRSLQKGADAK